VAVTTVRLGTALNYGLLVSRAERADGNHLLRIRGLLQSRYIHNSREDSGDDDDLAGFQIRRSKFKGEGHIYSDRLKYAFSLAGDRDDATTEFEDYYVEYDVTDGLSIRAGRWKQPFALQNLRSSSRQLAVERSSVHEIFRVDRSEGIMAKYKAEMFNIAVALNDGKDADFSDFDENSSDFAITARGEVLLAGDWKQFKDGSAWSEEPMAAMFGAGVHYERGETGNTDDNDNVFQWTLDLSFETSGLGVLLAGYGMHTDNETADDFDDYGLLFEVGYMVIPDKLEPFFRYEGIFVDEDRAEVSTDATEDMISIITLGANYYHKKHASKFTVDFVYALDPLVDPLIGTSDHVSTGLGLKPDADGEDGQWAFRAQYQLTF